MTTTKWHKVGAVVLLFGSMALSGATITCTTAGCSGNLGGGNPLAEIKFTASTTETLTVTTDSWTGGAGSGFDPVLWLFDSTMTQLTKNDDISLADRNAQISFSIVSGTMYELVLTAFDQHWCVASTVCNGTVYSTTGWTNNGDLNGLTDAFSFTFAPTTGFSIDSAVVTVDYPLAQGGQAAVPEPGSVALLLTGGAFLAWRKRATPFR